jgi:hypothetical protein
MYIYRMKWSLHTSCLQYESLLRTKLIILYNICPETRFSRCMSPQMGWQTSQESCLSLQDGVQCYMYPSHTVQSKGLLWSWNTQDEYFGMLLTVSTLNGWTSTAWLKYLLHCPGWCHSAVDAFWQLEQRLHKKGNVTPCRPWIVCAPSN